MFSRILRPASRGLYHVTGRGMAKKLKHEMRVTIIGAAGRLGSTLGLLLKQSPLVDRLIMMDIAQHNCGVAMELSHIDTKCRMQAYTGEDQTCESMKGSKIVVICAGDSRREGQSVEDMFQCNASTVESITEQFAIACPKACLCILSQPINSLVPMVSEILKQRGVYNAKKVFGISNIDVIRASTFVAEEANIAPNGVIVPLVGGHSKKTLVPILSQTKPCLKLSGEQICDIIKLTRKSADWVMALKDGDGAAVLAPAYAAARFIRNLIRGLNGEKDVTDCAYINTDATPGLTYCVTPIELGTGGVASSKLPRMCDHEKDYLQRAICELKPQIKQGEDFILRKDKDQACAANK